MVWIKTKQICLILLEKARASSNLWVMKTHITGALVHGRRSYAYVDLHLWPHDSNLTINVLLNVLFSQRKELSDVLYLQLDNCFRENKNQYVFGFLALLVQHGIFKEVYMPIRLTTPTSSSASIPN